MGNNGHQWFLPLQRFRKLLCMDHPGRPPLLQKEQYLNDDSYDVFIV